MKSTGASVDNVRVSCRFRPLNAAERHSALCVSFDGPRHVICRVVPSPCGAQQMSCPRGAVTEESCSMSASTGPVESYRYTFSRVYSPDTTQQQLYEDVARPIVDDVMRGYNGTVLVYGQTGSGKTHTMFGPHAAVNGNGHDEGGGPSASHLYSDESAGIAPRAVRHLFHAIHSADETVEFEIRVLFVEVYMERVRDLLNPAGGNLHVREDASGFYVEGCEMPYVTSVEEVLRLVRSSFRRRVTTATVSNDASSRSHCVLNITVRSVNRAKHEATVGKLFLVDLAGCEKVNKTQADGLQLEEAKLINKSLTTLGHVIMCLAEKQAHVPYRDSKLTRILKDSIGGNSRTALVLCCSPSQLNGHETLSSVRFGARAQNVCNRAVVNRQLTVEELKSMLDLAKAEIQHLRQLLQNKPGRKSSTEPMTARSPSISQTGNGLRRLEEFGDYNNVEALLQQGAREQLSLGALQAEVEHLRDALREAQYTTDLLHTQSAMQTSLVQLLQEESAIWEEEFTKAMRELHAQRRCVDHYRTLLQEVRDEAGLVPRQLSLYLEQVRAIRTQLEASPSAVRRSNDMRQNNHGSSQHMVSDSSRRTTSGKGALSSSGAAAALHHRRGGSSPPEVPERSGGAATPAASAVAPRHTNAQGIHSDSEDSDDRFVDDEHEMVMQRMGVVMDEVEQLRNTNGALTLELQLAEKKLAIRHERIENLKFGLRQECIANNKLQWTLGEERANQRVKLQEARHDALHWRQRYDDLLNNSHMSSRKRCVERGGHRKSSTPALETVLLAHVATSPTESPITAGHGVIVKPIRGGNHKEPEEGV